MAQWFTGAIVYCVSSLLAHFFFCLDIWLARADMENVICLTWACFSIQTYNHKCREWKNLPSWLLNIPMLPKIYIYIYFFINCNSLLKYTQNLLKNSAHLTQKKCMSTAKILTYPKKLHKPHLAHLCYFLCLARGLFSQYLTGSVVYWLISLLTQ